MSPNRRIFLNIIATYGRSLYALVIGLFCGRWTLMVLGEVAYGLIGVVGGMTAFVAFLNGVMASGVGRFYAVSAGLEAEDREIGIERCREWFTTAVMIHTLLPLVLVAVGYPIGEWAVRNYLTVPLDRVEACVWVWRFSCLTCFFSMASVPFSGMYGAKQEIAELTIYSFVTSTLNVVFLYYALTHPSDWLVRLSAWTCALSVTPSLIISVRAIYKYPECRFKMLYAKCWGNIAKMLRYSGWLIIGNLASLLGTQGVSLFLNKVFGPRVNAASNVGNTLTGQCQTLSGSLIGAFTPAIMNAYGAGDRKRFIELSNLVNKLATLLILVFAIPLALEVDEVLFLWLKNPPAYAAGLCLLGLLYAALDKVSWGCCIAVYAVGKMALYEIVIGGSFLFVIPLSYVFYKLGMGVYCAGWALVAIRIFTVVARVVLARKIVGGFSLRSWAAEVAIPVVFVTSVAAMAGFLPRMFMNASFSRICVTSLFAELALFAVAWFMIFRRDERLYVINRIKTLALRRR